MLEMTYVPCGSRYNCEFIFREIKILREERDPIGKGSYGTVYYAKCDSLLCAAKCIHDIFFDDTDQAGRKHQLKSFHQECEMMASMKHPNIVQYLGYYDDRRTGVPCLLMELLDESLTQYLERLAGPVPLHTSIDFTHDIAMALDYLHQNNRMHCDLTSNNVLIIASSRAKVTDFGQSTLAIPENNYHVADLRCPGNPVYMPPEATRAEPIISSYIDSFSFGVLLIQILTRLFPSPKESTIVVSDFGPGGSDAVFPVKELVRRGNHIAMVNPHHPLLEIALYCINDEEEKRPQFRWITERISELKRIPEYDESQRKNPSANPIPQLSALNPDNDQRIHELQEKLYQLENYTNTLQGEVAQMRLALEKKDAVIEQLLDRQRGEGHSLERQTTSLTTHRDPTPTSLKASPLPVPEFKAGGKTLRWFPCSRLPSSLYGGTSVCIKDKVYVNGQGLKEIFELNPSMNAWSALPLAPTASFALVEMRGILTTVGGYTTQTYSDALYSLVMIDGTHSWKTTYPAMKEPRINAGAITTKDYLVVAGGEIQAPRNRFVSWNVELMHIDSRQWMTVDKLPKPAKRISMATSGSHLYIVGGVTRNNQPLKEIYHVSLVSLVNSGTQGFASRALRSGTCWGSASVPVVYSTCAVVNQQLLVLGGWDNQPSLAIHAMNIHPQTGDIMTWSQVGKLPLARFDAMASVLPGHRLVVIGGRGNIPGQTGEKILDAAEIACLAT